MQLLKSNVTCDALCW